MPLDKLLRKLKPTLGDRVRADRLTYLTREKMDSVAGHAQSVVDRQVRGMFIEAGVALGGVSIVLATRATEAGREFRGYDVFEMIPEPGDRDDPKSHERYEVIERGESSGIGGDEYYGYREDLYGDVVRSFSKYGLEVDGESIALVQGLFEETMHFDSDEQLAFVHIDCDWYDPVRYVLETTWPRLSPGGIVIADDYHDYGGCRDACEEFIEAGEDVNVVSTEHHLVLEKSN